jgi:SAM-dependent methyltransferase
MNLAPQSFPKRVNCPVCDTVCDDEPLYSYTSAQAAAHFCPQTRSAVRFSQLQKCISRLWQGNECVVRRCRQCGFAFGFPFVAGDEEFYRLLHEQKHYPNWRWDYDVATREAVRHFAGGKVLDIGAGVGMFLRKLDNNWKCYAVEGSDDTRRELELSGITVIRDLEEAATTQAGTFQVITLFQVLEHIANFGTLLSQCRRLLAPGGRLVITVPDCDAMIRQERLTGCPDMPPNHINKWTPESLSRALSQARFECSEPIYEPASWKNLKSNLHMRVSTDATEKGTFAAQVYRIQQRPVRIGAMSLLAVFAFLRMLPSGRHLLAGGAFGMVGVAT